MSRRKFLTTELGARMRTARIEAGMTAAGVAARLYVGPNTVRGWESGRRCPAVTDLDQYLRVVGATLTLGEAA
jgi:transcriptional regulator with XRE-family HTH domain